MATAVATTVPSQLTSTAPPNQSLYIQNLPEKLQKDDLRRALYMLFSTYGPVLDITALKTKAMRGQAHVLFRDQQSATQALRSCHGNEFFGREMKIAYSKNRSNTLAKLTGTFNQPTAEQAKTQIPGTGAAPSSFPAPPGAGVPAITNGPPTKLPPPPGLPAKVGELKAPTAAAENAPSPQGTKRQRDESEDEEDAEMEVEEDDEGAMEMSDDED
ncbi:hypothetical protein LTR85_003985 [Meristemomyces frigidus]|nr:hypothetical protein LTR85_003985 [Meristemomyces frigidus]